MGIQASGKSTFAKERFFATHVRISLDMRRTRHRESLLLDACFEGKQSFVVDNTNPARADRARYIALAKPHGFAIHGYYFSSGIQEALERNEKRPESARIPERGLRGTHARLELPHWSEGFDALYYVSLTPEGFRIDEWRDEVR